MSELNIQQILSSNGIKTFKPEIFQAFFSQLVKLRM